MKRLYRSQNEVKIAGICSGMGDYFEKDPVIFRLLFLLLTETRYFAVVVTNLETEI